MIEKQKLSIKDWAEDDRPREKMLRKGVDALSDAELLAILIGSGNTDETAVELSKRILASVNNNLHELGKQTISDLCRFRGIGEAKAITIEAAMELGRRRKSAEVEERLLIFNSTDIYHLFHPLMCDLHLEEFWILLLNQGSKVIDKLRISSGGITTTVVDARVILREAIVRRATSIALCHNHPSGNKLPSPEDDRLTDRLRQASAVMDIKLVDHVIVCDGSYYSYADEDRL